MAYAPALVVDPAVKPTIPYGLFSVLNFRAASDTKWENGVTWEPLSCDPASGIGDPECEPEPNEGLTVAPGLPKGDAEGAANGLATAFTVYFKEKCSPVGRVDIAQERAIQSLVSREQTAAEEIYWGSGLGNVPNLTSMAPIGGSNDPEVVLGAVTKAVRRAYGGLGVIHVGTIGASVLFNHDLLVIRGDRVFTKLGEPVVIGTGYPELMGGPGLPDPTAGNVYIIGAPTMFGYRSEIFEPTVTQGDLLDRGLNDMYATAERRYLIGHDPCGTFPGQILADDEGA